MKQTQALRVMMSGNSVFLTGAPGSGKTFVLNKFIQLAKTAKKRVAVTASTGIAATHIGGTTIHSWSGMGIRDEINDKDEKWLKENEYENEVLKWETRAWGENPAKKPVAWRHGAGRGRARLAAQAGSDRRCPRLCCAICGTGPL